MISPFQIELQQLLDLGVVFVPGTFCFFSRPGRCRAVALAALAEQEVDKISARIWEEIRSAKADRRPMVLEGYRKHWNPIGGSTTAGQNRGDLTSEARWMNAVALTQNSALPLDHTVTAVMSSNGSSRISPSRRYP